MNKLEEAVKIVCDSLNVPQGTYQSFTKEGGIRSIRHKIEEDSFSILYKNTRLSVSSIDYNERFRGKPRGVIRITYTNFHIIHNNTEDEYDFLVFLDDGVCDQLAAQEYIDVVEDHIDTLVVVSLCYSHIIEDSIGQNAVIYIDKHHLDNGHRFIERTIVDDLKRQYSVIQLKVANETDYIPDELINYMCQMIILGDV